MEARELFPEIEPYVTRRLKVSALHTIPIEEVGYKINPLGDHDFYGVDLSHGRR